MTKFEAELAWIKRLCIAEGMREAAKIATGYRGCWRVAGGFEGHAAAAAVIEDTIRARADEIEKGQ